MANEDLLGEIPLFQLLDESERRELLARLAVAQHPAGTMVFEYGSPGDSAYLIRRGQVEIFIRDDTGERILLDTVGPGELFGELSLLDGGPRTASVLVKEDLDALRLDRDALDHFLKQRPSAALDLLSAMGKRLRHSAEQLRRTASRNVNQEAEDRRTQVQKAADWIAEFSGSITFLVIHVVFFAVWIILNVPLPGMPLFDPFPFGLLTMVVSLEAIILSVFVLLSQNRQAAKDRIRGDVEYEVNLKAELEVAHLHEKVDRLMAETARELSEIRRALAERAAK